MKDRLFDDNNGKLIIKSHLHLSEEIYRLINLFNYFVWSNGQIGSHINKLTDLLKS